MEEYITYCAYCGKEIEYNLKLFQEGKTGEPACEECWEENEKK